MWNGETFTTAGKRGRESWSSFQVKMHAKLFTQALFVFQWRWWITLYCARRGVQRTQYTGENGIYIHCIIYMQHIPTHAWAVMLTWRFCWKNWKLSGLYSRVRCTHLPWDLYCNNHDSLSNRELLVMPRFSGDNEKNYDSQSPWELVIPRYYVCPPLWGPEFFRLSY